MTNSATPHRIDVWHEKKTYIRNSFETYSIINRPSSHEARDRGPSLEASWYSKDEIPLLMPSNTAKTSKLNALSSSEKTMNTMSSA